MDGTGDPEGDGPGDDQRASWPVWKLAILLYPFTTAAVAINLFMLGLVGRMAGIGTLSPNAALLWSIPFGVPVTWLVTRWVQRLMDEAAE